jgi:hypothetical protein
VAASLVVDRMNALVAGADKYSFRAASSIGHDWGDDIKIEIPETGVTLGELDRLLRRWLGRETRVSGEIYEGAGGLVVRTRAGSRAPVEARGGDDVEALVRQAADELLAGTQPYRYGIWLENQGHDVEAERLFATTAAAGPKMERAWAYEGWTQLLLRRGDNAGAVAKGRAALALEPNLVSAYPIVQEWNLGRWQKSLEASLACERAFARDLPKDYSPAGAAFYRIGSRVGVDDLTGAFADEFRGQLEFSWISDFLGGGDLLQGDLAALEDEMHDTTAARRRLAANPRWTDGAVIAQSWARGPMPRPSKRLRRSATGQAR